MGAAPFRFLGLSVTRDELDPDTRRRVPCEPYASLQLVAEGQSRVREVRLSDQDLRRLLVAAAEANLRINS